MKKTVIIAILIIYLASILAVNFFGLQMVVSSPTVYVEEIKMNGITLERTEEQGSLETFAVPNDDGYMSYRFYFVNGNWSLDNVDSNPNVVKLNYEVLPEGANQKDVDIVYAQEDAVNIVVRAEEGEIVFLKRATVKITLVSKDGSLVKTSFWVSARRG